MAEQCDGSLGPGVLFYTKIEQLFDRADAAEPRLRQLLLLLRCSKSATLGLCGQVNALSLSCGVPDFPTDRIVVLNVELWSLRPPLEEAGTVPV